MEEISLKDIISIIWKGKWLIAIVTAIAMVLGLAYCLFLAKPQYEAESVLMVSPIESHSGLGTINTVPEIVEYLSNDLELTMESYIEQVKLAPVLDEAADYINYDKSEGSYLKAFSNKITIENPADSNLLYIKFKDSDSDIAIKGADAVADAFIEYVSDTMKIQANAAIEFISEQYNIENKNVEDSLALLTEFLSQSRGVDELQGELENNLAKINNYKSQLMELEIYIAYNKVALEEVQNRIDETPEFITIVKAVGNDEVLMSVLLGNSSAEYSDIAELTMVEQIPNEAFTLLVEKFNDYSIAIKMDEEKVVMYSSALTEIQKDIEPLQLELAVKKAKSEVLQENVNIAKEARDLYQTELKTVETKLVADIGKKSVIKVADAMGFTNVGISKVTIMILVTIIGAILGVLAVFLKHAWIAEEKEKKMEQTEK